MRSRKSSNFSALALGDKEVVTRSRSTTARASLHYPGVTGAKKFRDIARAALGDDVANLMIHQILIARNIIPRAKHANRCRESRALLHVREHEGIARAGMFLVVDQEILFRDAVAELDNLELEALQADAFLAVFSEDERLAVFQLNHVLAACLFVGEVFPGAVVEDVAILEDLDVRGASMGCGLAQRFFQMLLEDVHGAGHERGFRPDGQRNGIERPVRRAIRSGLGLLV